MTPADTLPFSKRTEIRTFSCTLSVRSLVILSSRVIDPNPLEDKTVNDFNPVTGRDLIYAALPRGLLVAGQSRLAVERVFSDLAAGILLRSC